MSRSGASSSFRRRDIPEGPSYLGFLFARGSSLQQVEDALRAAHKQLRFEIAPSLKVSPSSSAAETGTPGC